LIAYIGVRYVFPLHVEISFHDFLMAHFSLPPSLFHCPLSCIIVLWCIS